MSKLKLMNKQSKSYCLKTIMIGNIYFYENKNT